ncbi:hypothetical protein VST63_09180 [Mycolicibacterium sp. 050232]|uniref:hypothetical protein n=1 Tax=Mycolicibacterium sp. 050232 TaxID=3113982 RepID=UPI002E2ABB77|nr:hypothetical protein [Mycolicibacterium sp. 050232]MED5812534.1 hypothetical protein [Mycolicibacterium sp. 050232]
MAGLTESTTVAESSGGAPLDYGQNGEATEPMRVAAVDHDPAPKPSVESKASIGWLVCGGLGILAVIGFLLFGPGQPGSKAEWFFGAVVFVVVMVTMWLILTIQRQAKYDIAQADERLRRELAAADERSALELALTQKWHRAQMDSQQKLHAAELVAQQELARIERNNLLEQLQKQAMIEVSRAVGAHTRMLATLWTEGATQLRNPDRDERETAMNALFGQMSQVVSDVSVELDNAHLLSQDDRLQDALNRVNDAVLMAIQVAEDLHADVVEGRTPETNPVPAVQRLLHERATAARRLAWSLLRTGLEGTTGASQDVGAGQSAGVPDVDPA